MKIITFAAAVSAIVLAGCSHPIALAMAGEESIREQSNYSVCRASTSPYSTRTIDDEVERRHLDCRHYGAADAARRQGLFNAGAAIMSAGQQAPSRQTTTNCTRIGQFVNCTSQ